MHIGVMSCLPDQLQADAFTAPVPVPDGPLHLRVEVDCERLQFAYRINGEQYRWLAQHQPQPFR